MENGAAWLWQGIQRLGTQSVLLDPVHMSIYIDFTYFLQFMSFIR